MKSPTTPDRAPTSASNIQRRRLCPKSATLERGWAEENSEASDEGVLLHSLFLTGKRPDTLTMEQVGALNLADYYAGEFFANVRRQFDIPVEAPFVDEREVQLTLHDADGSEVFPGHADVIRTWPDYDVSAVADAKFGFLEVDVAADNDQLASYACMKQQQRPRKAVAVAIIQPRNFGPRMTQAVYLAENIPTTTAYLIRIHRESQSPDAVAVAGEKQCHFCKAKTVCDAYREKYLGITTLDVRAVSSLSNDGLLRIYEAVSYAGKIADDVRAEMRARVERNEMPGYKLQNSGDNIAFTDIYGFYNALKAYFAAGEGFDATAFAAQFDACRGIELGKLFDLCQARLGKVTEKAVEEFLRRMMEPFVTRTPKAKRVVRDKNSVKALPN